MTRAAALESGSAASERASTALVGLLVVGYVAYVLTGPQRAILALLSDDAFYYFKIATHVMTGVGCTFDGIAPTNGFHPLWLLALLPVFGFVTGGPNAPVVGVMMVNTALAGATLYLLARTVDRHLAPGFGIVALAAALLPNFANALVNGMETGLQLLLLTVTLYLATTKRWLEPEASARGALAMGAMLGFVALSRLDSIFLYFAASAFVLARARAGRFGPVVRRWLALSAGFAVIFSPYLMWNVMQFGHLTPVSGRVKSAFPAVVSPLSLGGDKAIGAVMIAALIVLVAAARRGRARALLSDPFAMLGLGCVLHFIHAALFLSWGVYWWHFTMVGLALVVAVARFASVVAAARPRMKAPVTIGLVAVFIVLASAMKAREMSIRAPQHAGWLEAAQWARENTPEDAVFAVVDAGLFGYYSGRRVVNLDGKANGYDFLEHLESNNLDEYLRRVNVSYIGNIRVRYRNGTYRISLQRANRPSVRITVREEWEVFRSRLIPSDAPRFGTPTESHFVIWQYPMLTMRKGPLRRDERSIC